MREGEGRIGQGQRKGTEVQAELLCLIGFAGLLGIISEDVTLSTKEAQA